MVKRAYASKFQNMPKDIVAGVFEPFLTPVLFNNGLFAGETDFILTFTWIDVDFFIDFDLDMLTNSAGSVCLDV